MKKFLVFLLMVTMTLCLTSCAILNPENPGGSETGKDEESEEKDTIQLEENTPQSWIDLFTFDNVTILLKNNLTIKRGDEYKCVGGKWYCKYQGSEIYEEHNGRYIFDLYLCNYSKFEFDSDNSCYKATGITLDESGYLRDIGININNGHIVSIQDIGTNESSIIISTLDFYSYGETTID